MAGHSRLPKGMAVRSMYETLTITIEADHKYHVIIEASCTLATEHGRGFVAQILRGHSLRDGIEEIVQDITIIIKEKRKMLSSVRSKICIANM